MFEPIRPRPTIPSCSGVSVAIARPSASIPADQAVRRAVVMQVGLAGCDELRLEAHGERLPELDAPLVERVDAPDCALHEDEVLVEGDERTEDARRQLLGEDRV